MPPSKPSVTKIPPTSQTLSYPPLSKSKSLSPSSSPSTSASRPLTVHTILPTDTTQLFDPVLVQLNKVRQRYGNNYR